jgi:hypothetical protein
MKPEYSLPYSQESTSGPYPEPDECIHIFLPCFPKSHLHLGLPRGVFPSGLPTKILYILFIPDPFMLYALPVLSSYT